jgi:hypothetical protein
MKPIIISILALFITYQCLQAQELNAKITLNTQKVQTSNKDIFKSLEDDITQLFTTQKWTNAEFGRNERIDCNISIIINEMPTENSFKAEISITSRRPVYNSTYLTTLCNYRDTKFEFDYIYGQMMSYSEMNISSNLVATLAFYAYVIIGLDFDSFSLNGGKPYFEKALEIANSAQSLNTKGWEPFSGGISRYDLAIALTEESSKDFHTAWYNYHRLGLDEMAANASRSRMRIVGTLSDLNKLYDARPSSPLLSIFSEAKLNELVSICSQSTADEKKQARAILQRLFPTKSSIIGNL